MDNNVEVIAASALYLGATFNYFLAVYRRHVVTKKRFRRRRCWMQEIHQERSRSSLNTQLEELLTELSGEYFIHMSAMDFEYLLQRVSPLISKQDTRWRESIPAKIRLAVTLRYLATGDSYSTLHRFFKISSSLVSRIIPEVCGAFVTVFKDLIKMPATPEEWFQKSEGFSFPHCIGAIDGKHIPIWAPSYTGPEDMNYEGGYSMVLLTLVDSTYNFLYADVMQSQNTDSKVFIESDLWLNINTDNLNLPPFTPLPGDEIIMPYVFVTDGTLPLERHVMIPFPGHHLSSSFESIYNQLVVQSHSVVENAFGVLSGVFKVLLKPITLDPVNSAMIIRSCLLLHNFLMRSETSKDIYCPPGSVDTYVDGGLVTQGSWRRESQDHFLPLQSLPYVPDDEAVQIRFNFLDYIRRNALVID
ncbi:hypothetical protein PYW08_012783 [Mythimna loreyi]|uniref:Uncharacterized protein n=1 Tax=Mythimna loreyi TaxID=667449 RepID=A0ACC2Q140_9NEOP|nr:hypothetical protein PYW08_012783 [Mythimna loreyi]